MSAIFDFSSLVTVLLLLICTCTYLRELRPTIFEPSSASPPPAVDANGQPTTSATTDTTMMTKAKKREGFTGFFWKMSRIGERLSPYVGVGCIVMAVHILFLS